MPSTNVCSAKKIVVGNTAIPNAKAYYGCAMIAGAVNSTLTVYRGNAATDNNQIDYVGSAVAGNSADSHKTAPVDCDYVGVANGGLYCVLAGTGSLAVIYYSE